MTVIRENQSPQVSDSCNECGSFVDIGTVLEEDDTKLTVMFQGDDAAKRAEVLRDKAEEQFAGVCAGIENTVDGVALTLTFDVAAEKLIFQLNHGL